MSLRSWSRLPALLVLAACASTRTPASPAGGAPAPADGTVPEKRDNATLYSAVPVARYLLESRDSLAMEMPDGSFGNFNEKSSYLTISLAPAGAGFAVTMVLDSMRLNFPDNLAQALVDSAVGTRWQGSIGANGRVESLEPDHPSVFGEQVRTSFRRLFPVLPVTGAKPGDQWADSSSMTLTIVNGLSVQEHRTTEYRAEKLENMRGVRVLVLQSTTAYRVEGAGTSFGQELSITGRGTATGTHRISTDGRLLEASVSDSVGMSITVPAVGQTVPTVATSRYTLRLLP
ncbi:MAG TPA: hypothetical protein VGP80_01535 [Gemmatimonadales bacterium]|nr:hypothetical protein [Gemmatimonadales bacterium]